MYYFLILLIIYQLLCGLLNYWNNTINNEPMYKESDKMDANGISQKENYINFDGERVLEFIINGKGDTSFDVYGLEKVIQKEVIYEMEDIIVDAIKILNSYVMKQTTDYDDAANAKYLMKEVSDGFVNTAPTTTDSLMEWDDIIKKGKFYDTFSNSSLLNVLYYVKDSRGYVKQYNASDNQEIFNNFKGLEAIMNLYMMGSNDGEIDFQSLFNDNSIGERSVGVGAAFVFKKVDTKSYYGSTHPGPGWSCVTVAQGSGYSCTKDIYDSVKTEKYNYLNDIYKGLYGVSIAKGKDELLNNIKFDSKQSLGQPIDNYIFRDTYMTPNGSTVSSNNFKIDGFINLLNSIINSKSNEYMLVKSDAKKDRYYAYKKLDNPEIIRTHDDNYNSLRIFKDGNYKSLGQYIFEMIAAKERPDNNRLWEGKNIYNYFFNNSNDFINGLFNPVNISDYFDINGSTGKQIFTTKNDVKKDVIEHSLDVIMNDIKFGIDPTYDSRGNFYYNNEKRDFYDSYGMNIKHFKSGDEYPYKNLSYKENFILDIIGLDLASDNYGNSEKFLSSKVLEENFGPLSEYYVSFARRNDEIENIYVTGGHKKIIINGVNVPYVYYEYGHVQPLKFNLNYDKKFNKISSNGFNEFEITFDKRNIKYINIRMMFEKIDNVLDFKNADEKVETQSYFNIEVSSYIGKTKSTLNENKTGSFTIVKNITNDKEQTLNGITDFNITINNNDKKLYNYHLSYDLKPNETCGENFVKVGGKCYYKHPASRVDQSKPAPNNIVSNNTINGTESDGVLFNFTKEGETIINNLPQRKEFTLSYGFRDGSGVYTEVGKEIFTTGIDMVRNPYGTTLSDTKKVSLFAFNTNPDIQNNSGDVGGTTPSVKPEFKPNITTPDIPKHCAINDKGQVVCNGNAWLKEEFIPYDLKEWLFEKQYNELVGEQTKKINGYIYKVDAKYLSKLSKNNTIRIGFALVGKDGKVVNADKQMQLKFVNDIGGSGYHENTYNLSSSSASITSKDGIFYYDLTDKEKILFKNVYNEDYVRFVDEYIFKNYIIEVESDEFLNLSDVYTLKAMSFHDNRWSYLDYNQNNIMDERLDSTNQYYDQKGEIVFGESRTQFTPEIKPGLDHTVVGPNWHTSQIAGLTEWKMFRFYTKEGYKYYITGYNRNNGSNIIK